jgi:parallel beta-helix repeat protein
VWIGQSGDNRIIHNDIHDFYYTGISVGWTWGYGKSYAKNNKILSNHIHHIGQGMLSDMGAVYCLGVSPGTEVSGNIIHDVQSHGYGGWGLYTDEGSTGITMENNLVYRTKCGGFHQHYGKENTLRNNIFVDATLYQIQATRPEKHLSFTFTHNIISFKKGTLYQGPFFSIQSHIDHNLIWNPDPKKLTQKSSRFFGGKNFEAWKEKGHGVHSIIGDPQFANPEKDDYTPQNKALLQKIGFKDFSSSQAGVPANIRRTLTPSASAN